MEKIFFWIILWLSLVCSVFGFFGYTRFGNLHEEPPVKEIKTKAQIRLPRVSTKWIEQKLDNFNPFDNRTWKMRYIENLDFQTDGGPIFIYLGGEWEISPGRILFGHLVDMAREFNASLFYTEHRFYGQSRPTNNTSTENLKFLSIEQALEDVAHFINFIKTNSPKLKNSRVLVSGGSYSATMAVWLRQKYPHLIDAAWASSGPLHAKVDFEEYKEVMTESIALVGGEECKAAFSEGFKEMEAIIDSGNFTKLENDFKLCKPLDAPIDLPHFMYEISDLVANLVQGHRPGKIEAGCKFIMNEKFADKVEAIGAWVNDKATTCLDMSYWSSIAKFSNTTWDTPGNAQMRQWIYQTCTHFGWYQTSTSPNQIFGTKYPVEYFIQLCSDLYDGIFNNDLLDANVKDTNVVFGGFNPAVSRVYFTHGQLDPWRPMGVQEDLNQNSPAVVIPLAAHVADMDSIADTDLPEMKASKERIRELLIQWFELSV